MLKGEEFEPERLEEIRAFCESHGTLEIGIKNNGLFAASSGVADDSVSGYQNAWLRDTVMVANYFRERGDYAAVRKTLKTLANYLFLHRERFSRIIERPELAADRACRPHVRFDGDILREIAVQWAHAQNDALGYALWLPFVMANAGQYELDSFDVAVYSLFPAYFEAIRYWEDSDSGHWEEVEMVHNSSVGVVVGALEQMRGYLAADGNRLPVDMGLLDRLIALGRERLRATLPFESPPARMADAALLFLIYPMDVVDADTASSILEVVETQLSGEHGVRRYVGDSYWCQDYKKLLPPSERTSDFSTRIEERNRLLKPGMEAQWCIFDPVISAIHGMRGDLDRQIHHLRRALAQLTSDGQCPELYYVEDSRVGQYVPNDHVPLAWTQANLGVALEYMSRSMVRLRAGAT